MSAAVRSYVTAGVALVGAGVISAAQIVPPLDDDESRVVEAAVSLAAAVGPVQACTGYFTEGCDIWATPSYAPVVRDPSGSAANIPANLLNAVISIPRAFVDALNDLSYSLEVTGSWWVYTPTNVLGFDPADPPKITALANLAIPFKPLSNSVGDQLAWWARANLPMNEGCTGSVGPACGDPGAILSKMFLAPPWVLTQGYRFPELYNPVSDAEGAVGEEIPGSVGQMVPWSGASVKLDPADPVNSVINYLLADPVANTPKAVTLAEIGATLERFGKALTLAFNPFVPMSFLLKGWPYTALTPLFMPFVPLLCPTCNPQNPGLPPVPRQPGAAVTLAAAAKPATQPAVVDAASAVAVPAAAEQAAAGSASGTGAAGAEGAESTDGAAAAGTAESDEVSPEGARRSAPAPAAAEPTAPSPVTEDADAGVAVPDLAVPDLAEQDLAEQELAGSDTAAADAEPAAKQRRGQNSSSENTRRGGSPRAAGAAESGE